MPRETGVQAALVGLIGARDRCAPADHADVVVDNDDPARPAIVRWLPDAG